MEQYIVDAVAGAIVLISAILAYSRGLVREVLAIVGWVGAAVAAFYFAPRAVPLIMEIPYVKDVIASSCQLQMFAAFAAIFAVALIVMSIFTPLFAAAVQESALGAIDRGAGFLFGAARGALLIIVALIVYQTMGLQVPEVDKSRTVAILADVREKVQEQIPTTMPRWVEARYNQFMGDCPGTRPKTAIPDARTPPAEETPPADAPADNAPATNG
ncbi:MAG: CvpA family protein [Alphaproteobacteria bacterium]|nr:MAG: CvpA family protein [Alphaproteobacteria bacterium]